MGIRHELYSRNPVTGLQEVQVVDTRTPAEERQQRLADVDDRFKAALKEAVPHHELVLALASSLPPEMRQRVQDVRAAWLAKRSQLTGARTLPELDQIPVE